MSKGSTPRPLSVSKKTFDENWDRIFSNPDNKKEMFKNPEKEKDYPIEVIPQHPYNPMTGKLIK